MTEQYGYSGKILRVDLSSTTLADTPTMDYSCRFLGGRGIAAKIYWDEVPPEANAFSPENRIIFSTGPLAGFPGLAGSRWLVCGKSPATAPEHFSCSNLGGSWGALLKFAGYDAIVVQGRSDKPVYILVQNGIAEIRDASEIWGKSTTEVRGILKREFGSTLRVVACGSAGENLVSLATLLADNDASGSSGFGAVMGSKKLKAIAVRGTGKVTAARPERLRELTTHVRELKRGAPMVDPFLIPLLKTKREVCYGCIRGCTRLISESKDGTRGKTLCFSADFYQGWAQNYYGEPNEVPFLVNRLCDEYGVDTHSLGGMLRWLMRCHQDGILTDENTDIPISRLGSLEFMEALLKRISFREGFGDILAYGTQKAAELVGSGAEELIDNSLSYDPRMYITTGLFYATEPRWPIQQLHRVSKPLLKWLDWMNNVEGSYVSTKVLHSIARRFWGSELAVDYSTCDGKALCAKMVQNRTYAKESLVFCDFSWPITDVEYSEDHVGDPSLESRILAAVTGMEISEENLYQVGERVFNLQRAILVKEGHRGRQDDKLPEFCHTMPLEAQASNPECLIPGKGEAVISRKGALLDRAEFERMKDEYYDLRDWDITSGLPTETKLKDLELPDVAKDLKKYVAMI